MRSTATSLAEVLIEARTKRGWTQDRSARYLRCTDRCLRNWEGGSIPHLQWLPRIEKLSNVSLATLIRMRREAKGAA